MALILFDIDGTLADDRHRRHHALAKEWEAYFRPENMHADTVLDEGKNLVEMSLALGHDIAYLTGRREDRGTVTRTWLQRNGFPVNVPLYMRARDQKMVLAEFKVAVIRDLLKTHSDVVLYDDDDEVVRLVTEKLGPQHIRRATWCEKEEALVRRSSL